MVLVTPGAEGPFPAAAGLCQRNTTAALGALNRPQQGLLVPGLCVLLLGGGSPVKAEVSSPTGWDRVLCCRLTS